MSDADKFRAMIRQHRDEVRGRERAQFIRDQDHDTFNKLHENQDTRVYHTGDTERARTQVGRPHRPLRYYVTLGDPALSVFINDAKEKARGSYNMGMRHWFKDYFIDIALVSVKLFGRLVLIRIMPADSFYFEFASSSWPIQKSTVSQMGISFDMYHGVHVGVHVAMVQGKLVTDAHIRKQRRSTIGGSDTSVNARGYQVQLINEPVLYPFTETKVDRLRAPYELYGSFAPSSAHTGVHTRSTELSGAGLSLDRGSMLPYSTRDIGFDIPYEDSEGTQPIRMAFIQLNADWPRENGKQLVKSDEWGERMFGIYCDAFNQFHVFPVAAIEETDGYNQNVPTNHVIRLTPSIPTWCYKQASKVRDLNPDDWGNGHWQVDQPEPEWVFRHDGKRAVSIFFERVKWERDSALFDSGDGTGATDPFTTADFNAMRDSAGVQGRYGLLYAPGYNEDRYYAAPGIIELEFVIELNGPDLDDFTAAVNVREVRRPTTSQFCSLYVGYVWYDVPFGAKVKRNKLGEIVEDERIGKIGDLVTVDTEIYYDTIDTQDRTQAGIVSFKRIGDDNTEVEILTAPGGGTRFYAIDIRSLSYVLQLKVRRDYLSDDFGPNVGYGPSGITLPYRQGGPATYKADVWWMYWDFVAMVVIGGKTKELLAPKTQPEEITRGFEEAVARNGATPLGWRKPVTDWVNAVEEGQRVFFPLNDSTDWSTGTFGDYRLWKLTGWGNLVGPHAQPGDSTHWDTFLTNACWTYSFPSQHYYTATPKFAWAAYQEQICNLHDISVNSTFFVHPGGSWAFWRNLDIYNPEGMNYVEDGCDSLSGWDAKVLEHVICDRVHFEMRTEHLMLGQYDTTFQALYNRAVAAGKKARTLEANIEEITDDVLRAKFEKETYAYPNPDPPPNITALRVKSTWDSNVMYYMEPGIANSEYFISAAPYPPNQGGLLGLTFDAPWAFDQDWFASDFGFPALEGFHVRFCNAIILQAKS